MLANRFRRLVPIAFVTVTASAATAGAQACIGIPAGGNVTVAYGFEGTDGLSGQSGELQVRGARLGAQLKGVRYDGLSVGERAFSADVQLAQWLSTTSALEGCRVLGVRYQRDARPDFGAFQRWRVPYGLAFGHAWTPAFVAHIPIAAFVEPQAVLQYERWRPAGGVETVQRTRVAAAGTAGLGFGTRPLLVRTALHYAGLPSYTLGRKHNFPELTVQIGLTF